MREMVFVVLLAAAAGFGFAIMHCADRFLNAGNVRPESRRPHFPR